MKKRLLGWYRTFKHKVIWVDEYSKKVMIVILSLLIIDLIVLYLVW